MKTFAAQVKCFFVSNIICITTQTALNMPVWRHHKTNFKHNSVPQNVAWDAMDYRWPMKQQ